MSAHVNRVHAGKAMKKDTNKGAFPCNYCEETFQSSRSRSMHVRNQHAAAQSARLAEESSLKTSADSQPRHWDEETVRQFVRALFVVGTGSNVEIAREMKSKKTAHNVKGYKLRFLKDQPDWKTEFRQLDPKYTPSDSERTAEEEEVSVVEEEETIQPPERKAEPESTAELVTPAEVEATPGEDAAVETEPPVEKEPITEDAAVETEPPVEKKPTTEVTVEEQRTPARDVEVETTAPSGNGGTGENVRTIILAYPIESTLDCPHCSMHFPGEELEDLRKYLREQHPGSLNAWLFLCALCADRYDRQEDALRHVMREHLDEVRSLPRNNILQDRDKLLAPMEPQEDDEEEVPPLPPPIFPPLPPEELPITPPPPPPPPPTAPPSCERDEPRKGKKAEPNNRKEEEARKALAELRDRYAESLLPFVDGELCEGEWSRFCELVQALPEELKKVLGKFVQKRGNPLETGEKDNNRKLGERGRRRRMATTTKSMVRIKVRMMIEEGTTGGTTTDETTMGGEERFEAITTGEEKTVEEMTTEITTGEKTVEEKIAEETTAEITTEEKTAEEKTVEETTIEITTGEKTAGEGGRMDGVTTEIITEESHTE